MEVAMWMVYLSCITNVWLTYMSGMGVAVFTKKLLQVFIMYIIL